LDSHVQLLSKWEDEALKAIELEHRLADVTSLYEAFANESISDRVTPRLVEIRSSIISRLRTPREALELNDYEFEQVVAEVLDRIGYSVLWVPGGRDQGIDIVASGPGIDYLIDVKRCSGVIQVELVRHVWGVAEAAKQGGFLANAPSEIVRGGIITSSRFSRGAEQFRRSVRERPLLRDGDWLQTILGRYVRGAESWLPFKPRPNNRLQGMRGLACFRGRRVLRAGPHPCPLCR
jgi:HJR/Mrr/RecB family endonuclease